MYSTNEELHSSVILQQRRLRHVTSLYIRNLTINVLDFHNLQRTNSLSQPFLYFTLHHCSQSEQKSTKSNILENVVYESEKVEFCPNPTWSSISFSNGLSTSITEFTLRLWIGIADSSFPALHWNIVLQQLLNIGDTLYSDKIVFHSNAVIVGFHGYLYTSSVTTSVDTNASMLAAAMQSDVSLSYKPLAMKRILVQQVEISISKSKISSTQDNITLITESRHKTTSLEVDLEDLQHKVNNLRRLLKREKALLSREREELMKNKLSFQQEEIDLSTKREELNKDRCHRKESYDSYMRLRDKIIKLGSHLGHRRRDVLSELSEIFPITEKQKVKSSRSKKSGNTKEMVFSICYMPLPNSESFSSRDDSQTSTSLGYAAQLLSMMSNYLLVPLRYPLVLRGSVSCIVDHVTEKLSSKERIFPLHVKGSKDRFLFEYGVFLLNKNVAQLRYYCGLGTSDLRPTLSNIKNLLDHRLGAKATQSHPTDPIAITELRTLKLETSPKSEQKTVQKEKTIPAHPVQIKITETKSSPYKRIEHRNSELSSLRGQLFGSESKKTRERSSSKNEDVDDITLSKSPLKSNYKPNIDSVETLNFASTRKQLTGLEEIGQAGKTKMSLASARAELMATKSNKTAGTSFSRWGKDNSYKNRSELFQKSNGEKSSSKEGLDVDAKSKSSTFSSSHSDDSSSVKKESHSSFSNSDDLVFIDSKFDSNFDNLDKENVQEKLPYMNAINGRIADLSVTQETDPPFAINRDKSQSNRFIVDEEFDFC